MWREGNHMQKKYYSKIIPLDSPFNVDSNGTYSLCTDSDINFEVFVVCSETGESWGYLFLKSIVEQFGCPL
jgi:hypothetical protein